jgi:futalosine hydrolase
MMRGMRDGRGGPTLVLVPTELERARLSPPTALTALCGFGPVAAAARAAQLLAELHPARVALVGIAGTYDRELAPIGAALAFGHVTLDAVGAGCAPPEALGFPQWPGSARTGRIPDTIALAGGRGPLLVTVAAASANAEEARARRSRHPGALAEDMEGFGVAAACALFAAPLAIVRGIANLAGERDKRGWRIDDALAAASAALARVLEDSR